MYCFAFIIHALFPNRKRIFSRREKKYELDITGAFELFGKAIELDSNYWQAYYYRGLIFAESPFLSIEVFNDFNKFIELYPDFDSSYFYRGGINKILKLSRNS
jgi:hypothetical protein